MEQRPESEEAEELTIFGVSATPLADNKYEITLQTSRGDIQGLLMPCEGEVGAVIWAASGTGASGPEGQLRFGPGDNAYAAVSEQLLEDGVTSLHLSFREPSPYPGPFEECVLDVLGAISFLRGIGVEAIALVGHSFAGGVVIKSGTLSPHVTAVVALASQLYGADMVARLSPRPLLLVHGEMDSVLEFTSSKAIYEAAGEPKELVLYPDTGHSFWDRRDDLQQLLRRWLASKVGREATKDLSE